MRKSTEEERTGLFESCHHLHLTRSSLSPALTRSQALTMRRGQRQNAILNSPVVRSFINPVVSTIPTSPAKPATAQTASAPSDTVPDGGVEADERFFIPTQPLANGAGAGPGTSDVKGKKRAREEDDDAALVEYDAVAATRFGVPVRYSEDNLPEELEKCASLSLTTESFLLHLD